jgi:hypothetical protein
MGHMFLPSRIVRVEGETATASYEYEGGNVMLTNLFAPKMYNPKPGEIWAVHFAGLLGALSVEEQKNRYSYDRVKEYVGEPQRRYN